MGLLESFNVRFDHMIRLGHVVSVEPRGPANVLLEGSDEAVQCDMLETTSAAQLSLRDGDKVLIWHPGEGDQRPVVLGRIGSSPGEHPRNAISEELLIEARKNLTLKCGAGSITIREDGKILIKGKDLVSHAQRLNRIKGGAVQIN
jgi:hypothetical protein